MCRESGAMKLRIIIIGAAGHGKSTLAKAIEHLSNIKCEVMNTQDLTEIKAEQILEEFKVGQIEEIKTPINSKRRKKGKEIKSWQRTKFYQR